MAPTKKFDPKDHLVDLKGAAYLPVAQRLVWFREEWPHGVITTEILELTEQRAVVKATAMKVDAEGNVKGSATGTKSQTPSQFKFGFIEKAETGAIGRALAALGFGTQFEPEFDEGDMLADAPVERQTARSATKPANGTTDTPAPAENDHQRAMAAYHATGSEYGFDHEELRMIASREEYLANKKTLASLKDAPVPLLRYCADLIRKNPENQRKWVDMQHQRKAADQAELIPNERTVPNPHHA